MKKRGGSRNEVRSYFLFFFFFFISYITLMTLITTPMIPTISDIISKFSFAQDINVSIIPFVLLTLLLCPVQDVSGFALRGGDHSAVGDGVAVFSSFFEQLYAFEVYGVCQL